MLHLTNKTRSCLYTVLLLITIQPAHAEQYARFVYEGDISYGRVSGQTIHFLEDGLFPMSETTDVTASIHDVTWLPPTEASKIFAVGMNFSSHRASKASAPPPLFVKLPSSLTGHNTPIDLPPDAGNVHYEGEMVLVIGKKAKRITKDEAADYIFGITASSASQPVTTFPREHGNAQICNGCEARLQMVLDR